MAAGIKPADHLVKIAVPLDSSKTASCSEDEYD